MIKYLTLKNIWLSAFGIVLSLGIAQVSGCKVYETLSSVWKSEEKTGKVYNPNAVGDDTKVTDLANDDPDYEEDVSKLESTSESNKKKDTQYYIALANEELKKKNIEPTLIDIMSAYDEYLWYKENNEEIAKHSGNVIQILNDLSKTSDHDIWIRKIRKLFPSYTMNLKRGKRYPSQEMTDFLTALHLFLRGQAGWDTNRELRAYELKLALDKEDEESFAELLFDLWKKYNEYWLAKKKS